MPIPMNTLCHRCLLQKHTDTALTMADPDGATAFSRALMKLLAEAPEDADSSVIGPDVQALFQKHLGFLPEDSYREEKQQSNRFALEKLPQLRQSIAAAEDPVYRAMQLAVLGNYIDFSALQGEVSFEKLDEMLALLHTIEVDREVFRKLRADLEKGRELLYLTDNAGEIVFDRVWLEVIRDSFPNLSVTVCVRGGNAQNDATVADAEAIGMPFPVTGNGTRIPGTVLELASEELKEALCRADIIIAKGQANVETLLDTGHGYNIYYAFLVKCRRFIDRFGKDKLTPMLVKERDL